MKRLILVLVVVLGAQATAIGDETAKDWKVGNLPLQASDALIAGNVVVLRNRGSVISKKAFPDGCSLSFQWKWTKGQEAGAYQDVLAVGFHTDGKFNKWPHEISRGIVVRFEAHAKIITIGHEANGKNIMPGIRKEDVPMERDTWYKARIVCGANETAVYFGDDHSKPMLTAPMPSDLGEDHYVVIYNREPVAAVIKESVLKDVRLEGVKQTFIRPRRTLFHGCRGF